MKPYLYRRIGVHLLDSTSWLAKVAVKRDQYFPTFAVIARELERQQSKTSPLSFSNLALMPAIP